MGLTDRLLDSVSEQVPAPDPAARPRLGMAVVTCMDTRVDPVAALGLRPGDAHVLRNAGGLVTNDVIDSLLVSQRVLGTHEIVVLHHTRCTGVGARSPGVDDAAAVRAAMRTLLAASRLPHRDVIRGLLIDTSSGRVQEVGVPPQVVAARPHATSRRATMRRCAWCDRPFQPTGHSRWHRTGPYCGDLCRLAARRTGGARR
jgi:carbonic anhydrase